MTSTTVVLPGECLEMDVPPDLGPDCTLVIEARTDALFNKCTKVSQLWPQPLMADTVASRVCMVNNTTGPKTVQHHKHLCKEHHTTTPPVGSHPSSPHECGSSPSQSVFFSDAIKVDPDNILRENIHNQFHKVPLACDDVFKPTVIQYNGAAGPVKAVVNMGPVQPPEHPPPCPLKVHN